VTDCVKMEGIYIDNDNCLQVVVPVSQEQWTIYGINGCNKGDDVYWTAHAKMSDVEQEFNNAIIESTDDIDNGNKCHVVIEGDIIKWPSGKRWNKIKYSYGQLQLLVGRRQPIMFTSLVIHLFMKVYDLITYSFIKKNK